MFSALKKLVTNEQGDTRPNIPSGMQTMGVSLQRKFARGVQYNMKVIIKGDRNTGKSTLFHRLQGEKFREEYTPTSEIQVASIHWNYKATDDVVKVEVWDVVDKGKPRKRDRNTLKIENTETETEDDSNPCLDASFLDVYKGTNGVVMMLDISKQWTWKYVQQELPKVPHHIPVLVMASFRDLNEKRAVYTEEIDYFIKTLDRPPGSAYIKVAESSMKNGFGLKYLHSFFNIPFLQLQRETLLQQLQRNQLETDATLEELDARVKSEDQDYDMYLASFSQKHKGSSVSLTVPNGQPLRRLSDTSGNVSPTSATPVCVSPAHTPSQLTPSSTPPPTQPKPPVQHKVAPQPAEGPSLAKQPEDQSLGNRFSKWFTPSESKVKQGTRVEDEKRAVIESPAEIMLSHQRPPSKINTVDDFIPDEGLDKGFFDDTETRAAAPPPKKSIFSFGRKTKPKPTPLPVVTPVTPEVDSDSDDGANPMVAGFQEELDSEDEATVNTPAMSPGNEEVDYELDSPDSHDHFSREPPRWDKSMSSSGEDSRPVVAGDVDLDSDTDNHPIKSLRASQTSDSLPSMYSAYSGHNVTESSTKSMACGGDKNKNGGIQSSLFSLPSSSSENQHAKCMEPTTKIMSTPSHQEIDSSPEEAEDGGDEITVLQDCVDISDDEQSKSKTVSKKGVPIDDSNEEETNHPKASRMSSQGMSSPTSLGLTLELADLNFLESVTSNPAKKPVSRNVSRASDEFDVLVDVVQDDISESETNTSTSTSSSARKKKHKSKDREKDQEKSHKKEKHKKHRDHDRKRDTVEGHGQEAVHDDAQKRRKKKNSSSSVSNSSKSSKRKNSSEKKEKRGSEAGGVEEAAGGREMEDTAALEAFLEGF
ncbi:rab-like protein 6 isoform X2 [Diadema antillarum]|uniref:rab-like protein 6 isoform X2 n=2 Tax=Diadema antillarum TaxID=105358 RepID=UPI003A89CC8C